MRLSSWVNRNRLRQCEAAERLGVSAGYLSELLATEADPNHPRARRCSKRLAKQINERTGGKVGLMDLLYPEARKTRKTVSTPAAMASIPSATVPPSAGSDLPPSLPRGVHRPRGSNGLSPS